MYLGGPIEPATRRWQSSSSQEHTAVHAFQNVQPNIEFARRARVPPAVGSVDC